MTPSTASLPLETYSALPDSPDAPYAATANAGDFFETLLDIVNPLQHIPIVSNLYREITGDTIAPMSRMVGGALFGGPVGFASATANVFIEQASGDDLMGHAVALVSDDSAGPALQANAAQPDGPAPIAENAPAQAAFDEIAWSGPRVLPSLARPDIMASEQLVNKTLPVSNNTTTGPGPTLTAAQRDPDASDLDASGPDASGAVQLAAADSETAQPDWMADALLAAGQARAARNSGEDPELPAQPWATNAMLQALEKYEAMTRARNADPDAPGAIPATPGGNAGDTIAGGSSTSPES